MLRQYKVTFRVVGFDFENEYVLWATTAELASKITVERFEAFYINLQVNKDSILVQEW